MSESTAPVVELLGPAVGGIRSHVLELSRRLRAGGQPVVVAGPAESLGSGNAVDEVVDVPRGDSPLGLWRARRQLADVMARSGAVVVHAHGLKAGWVAVTVRPRPAIVLTAHNIVLPGAAGPVTGVLRVFERGLVRRVDQLIAPSPAISRQFADVLPAQRRHVIVPVSPPAVAPRPRAEVRAELGVGTETPLVVVTARLHPQKDLATFVRAMRRVADVRPDVVARIVGDGAARPEIEALLAEHRLGDTVVLVGASDRAVDQMAAADVVALSSIWEAVPLVVLEAMELGVPVVTTRVGIVDEVITTGENGWVVEVGDDAALAEALIDALADPDRLVEAGRSARRAVAALADPDALTAAVREVYRTVDTSVDA